MLIVLKFFTAWIKDLNFWFPINLHVQFSKSLFPINHPSWLKKQGSFGRLTDSTSSSVPFGWHMPLWQRGAMARYSHCFWDCLSFSTYVTRAWAASRSAVTTGPVPAAACSCYRTRGAVLAMSGSLAWGLTAPVRTRYWALITAFAAIFPLLAAQNVSTKQLRTCLNYLPRRCIQVQA